MRLFLVNAFSILFLLCSANEQSSTTTATSTTTEEYEIDPEEYEENNKKKEVKLKKKSFSFLRSKPLVYGLAGGLVVSGCFVSCALWCLSRRRKAQLLAEEDLDPGPQKMDSEPIIPTEFQDKGPLVMQARMKGTIKHALDNEKSNSLKEIQFDPKYNEICLIGSDVEQLEGMSQLSLLSGEKSAEPMKAGVKKGAFPTMATEAKRQEAELQRRRENERRMAESAMRRRAKDEATAKAAAEAAATPSALSHPTSVPSSVQKSDRGNPEAAKSPASDSVTPVEEMTQYSMRSTISMGSTRSTRSTADRKAKAASGTVTPKSPRSPYQLPSLAPPESTNKPKRTVFMRRKPSNDGRFPDALGVRKTRTLEDKTSSSSQKSSPSASKVRKSSHKSTEQKSTEQKSVEQKSVEQKSAYL